jgi:ribosomal protein S18 acetylase RimI-like enzyme
MTVTIRQASDEDVGTLASLQPTVHDLHVSRAPERFKPVDQGSVNVFCFGRRVFEMDHVAVASGHRKMGVARALIAQVLEDASSRGVRDVELSGWSFSTEALAAFKALGFEPKVVRFGRASF